MAAVVGITEGPVTEGYNVPIIVPRLVMKASPGPVKSLAIRYLQVEKDLA